LLPFEYLFARIPHVVPFTKNCSALPFLSSIEELALPQLRAFFSLAYSKLSRFWPREDLLFYSSLSDIAF